jgi:hypothetical protein
MENKMAVKQWLAICEDAALQIDPETAEFTFWWGQIMDPYGIHPDLPEECYCVGRLYFARSPESDVWVSFYNLPEVTVKRLWERIKVGELRDIADDFILE